MSTAIELNCFENGNMNYMRRLKAEPSDFLNFDAGSLIEKMIDKTSDTAYYTLRDSDDKMNTLIFLVTQDEHLINELKMKKPKEARTLDLFSSEDIPFNTSFKQLIETFSVDQKESDFIFDNQGQQFSFKVAYGSKANLILNNLNRYMDELEMFNEAALAIKKLESGSSSKLSV